MKTIKISYPITDQTFQQAVVAIGSFDGIHLGHQKVINTARDLAIKLDIELAVMIFNPHPLDIIDPPNATEKIMSIGKRLKELEKLGVDTCYIVSFTKEFADLTDQEFVQQILANMNIKAVVVGFDFRYGKHGKGDASSLQEFARINNLFAVKIVEACQIEQIKVSSSRIRSLLLAGRIEEANQLLGRPYNIEGLVIEGDKRGRKIGYPTINLSFEEEQINLLKGVYIVRVYIDGQSYYGVMNVGSRPTFHNNSATITYEIHIINFNQDLYGRLIEVDVLEFLRPEKKFNNINQLIEAIKEDIEATKRYLSLLLND